MSKAAKKEAPTAVKVRLDHRVVIAALLLPLLLVGLWFFFTAPARTEAATAATEAADATAKVEAVQQQLNGLQTGLVPRSQGLLVQAVKLDQLLPAANDPIALGTSLTSFAASTGVRVDSFTKGGEYPVGKSLAQSYEVSATGTREQLSTFLDGLADYPQLLTVPVLSVGPNGAVPSAGRPATAPAAPPAAAGSLTATFTLLAWSSSVPALDVPASVVAELPAPAPAPNPAPNPEEDLLALDPTLSGLRPDQAALLADVPAG